MQVTPNNLAAKTCDFQQIATLSKSNTNSSLALAGQGKNQFEPRE